MRHQETDAAPPMPPNGAEDRTASLQADLERFKGKALTVLHAYKRQIVTLNGQLKELERLESQLWDLPVDPTKLCPFRPLSKNSAAIVAVINLKGGVGKTTITANLAATICRQMNQRVLVVDLDFQASLSGLCLQADAVEKRTLSIEAIMRNPFGDITKSTFENAVPTREAKMRLLSCGEMLPNIEERAKAAWLMNPGDADLRCVFRRILHDPIFQNAYDVILIDCPPRWTTASINAIACCDYVLIPTSLDRVSTEAVPRLLKWLRNLKSASPDLYDHFHVLGVVGNRAHPRAKLIAREQRAWDVLQARCRNAWGEMVHHFATVIQEKAGIHIAADHREFAVLNPELQPTFEKLVKEINERRLQYEGG